ncbi:MAG TPA: tetratricopeptide repeat protein [Rhizomicrobium sp.]|nr:tetratricopeptide repeat protein [Rhizomicrobium sp.]
MRQLFEQGVAAHRGGNLAGAEALYRQLLRADNKNFPALHMLGYLKAQQGQYDEAITLLNKAVKQKPDDPAARAHHAHALMAAQRFEDALAAYDRILAAQPGSFEAHYNRGVILSQLQRFEESLVALDAALALQPGAAATWYNRGVVMVGLEHHSEAMDCYDRALALDPSYSPAESNRIMVALSQCDWARAAATTPAHAAQVAPPLTLLGYTGDKALQLQCATFTLHSQVPEPLAPLWSGEKYRHDRIRLAYVSPDLRDHAVAFQLASLVERHDRSRFQVIGISTGLSDDSAIRARLIEGFDRFHDFAALNSEEIARRLREMEIDIAVDLGGHTANTRLRIFAHRFAPVQATWLGYPGTTGAAFIDYLIGDPVVTPFAHQPWYSEQVVHLPDTYFPAEAQTLGGAAPTRTQAGLPEDGFVFCAFNGTWKITPPVFDVWMRLLKALPGSVLWLRRPNPATCANLEREAAARGVDPARLVYADTVSLQEHLARHALADLFLDTLPYNAHATAANALAAGLPVLTCKGEAFAGRVAASLLLAVGLPELVTENLEDYERLALELAQDPARAKALKEKLAKNLPAAALFDADRFRRNIEAAYVTMSEQRGAARSFSV